MKQHSIHTAMIQQVAERLGPLRPKVVFLGGSATGFHITDKAEPEIRATEEFQNLRSQFVTSSWGGSRYVPMAFTEQGVAMLSSVLNSERAIQVNIQIMRAFNQLRKMMATHDDLKRKFEEMEKRYDEQFRIVFEAITQLLEVNEKPKKLMVD